MPLSLFDRILGCYLGKSIGGTLGMPYEGRQEFLDLTFYNPVPSRPAPNDDLDLQLVWLAHVHEKGTAIDRTVLGQAWLDHIDAHWDEYGIAIWNLKRGLTPPLTGLHNNYFVNGLGAAIRSEIWAALFPGRPRTAAYYACLDASVDHAGEGILAEMFLAAFQSDMYITHSIEKSLSAALHMLPQDSILLKVMSGVQRCFVSGMLYIETRNWIMKNFGSTNFTDCIMNLGFVIIGLLYGRGDFEKSILYAVNCGQDTDCTAATVGAVMGILYGKQGLPEKWLAPVGDAIVAGSYIKKLQYPVSVSALAAEIVSLHGSFINTELPEVTVPFTLPAMADFSDKIPWHINGSVFFAEGVHICVNNAVSCTSENIILETAFMTHRTIAAQLMVCSRSIFQCSFDGENIGSKGDQSSDIVPAMHRMRGGRMFNISLSAGKRHTIRIEMWPAVPVPDVWVSLGDLENRRLTDIEWG